ncbi:MAG: 23S rRNA (pseudouridine(1915)-N(3))-methyltransferase RlmH [Bdellovibrionales bacterium]
MKARFLAFESKVPSWLKEARSEYVEKINPFVPLEWRGLKSPSTGRDQRDEKLRLEGEIWRKEITDKDLVILFDEGGKSFDSSEALARQLGRAMESGKSRILFCLGGAYGFDDATKARADHAWSLSKLTYNHWVAQICALEQLYRGFTILRGIPYHNR